jgi:hypothetical protein
VFLAYEALKREGKIGKDVTFDVFIDEHLGDYGVDDNPESPTPPAR